MISPQDSAYCTSEEGFDSHQDKLETNPIMFSIKNFICQPNPLMQKVEFSAYSPTQHFPNSFEKLPPIVTAESSVRIDANNMQLIGESAFRHQKMKKDVLRAILGKGTVLDYANQHLPTLEEFYSGKQLVYEKFSRDIDPQSRTGEEKKPKPSHGFATYAMDISSIVKKQNPKCQSASGTVPAIRGKLQRSQSTSHRTSYRNKVEFSSNFQTGNLFRVYQREFDQYDLILQNDVNTKGNNQWFFFSLKGVAKGTTIKFNLVNLNKRTSLFEDGMKPTVFSMVRYEKRKIGWIREGLNIDYEENGSVKRQSNPKHFYTLSFSYKFIYDGDVVYFSHSYPYTYTDLSNFLSSNLQNKSVHSLVKLKNLGVTLGGNQVDMLQISDESEARNSAKKIIWVMGRQHPGEVTGSFMMEGIIDFLLSGNEDSKYLLRNYVFKVVPMVNVDGVIHGNSRAEIIGCDPNRKWENPHKVYNPVIYALRKAIEKDKSRIQMVLDLHSHSRKLGTFFYGNNMPQIGDRNVPKVFPMMVCKRDERFRFEECRFYGGNSLAARRVLFEKLQIPNVFTIESSFYGYQKDDHRIIPYYPKDYKEMAGSVLATFASYSSQKYKKMNPEVIRNQKATPSKDIGITMEKVMDELDQEMNQKLEKESDGSDSNPSQDQFSEKQLKKLLPKTFDIKKRAKKAVSKAKKKVVEKKEPKEQEVQPKPKKIEKDSHYKKYFSSRNSQVDIPFLLRETDLKEKQTNNFAVQVCIEETFALKQTVNSCVSEKKVGGGLCIFGKKLEEDIFVLGTCVGVQADCRKQFTKNRNQLSGTRRSFKLPCRPSSIMQIKDNNFLNRGTHGHLLNTQQNFFNSRR